MNWTITTPPSALPIEYVELKRRLKLATDDDEQRDDLMLFAAECVSYAERKMQISLMPRTITAHFWSDDQLRLPRGPVIEVVSCTDANSTAVTYELSTVGNSDRLTLTSTPSDYPLTVVYRAGHELDEYGAVTIDADILGLIRTHICTAWRFREAYSTSSIATVWKLDDFYREHGRGTPVA